MFDRTLIFRGRIGGNFELNQWVVRELDVRLLGLALYGGADETGGTEESLMRHQNLVSCH